MAYQSSAFCDRRRQFAACFVSVGLAATSLFVPWFVSDANASPPVVTNYTGTGISVPLGIAAGPDGALWFTNSTTPSGASRPEGSSPATPERASARRTGSPPARTAPCGSPTTATTPSGASRREGSSPTTPERASASRIGIAVGPDGALWFTNSGNNSIGRITTGGIVTNYTGTSISEPNGITAGPDGALWFTNAGNNSIGRITTGGTVTNYTGTGISEPDGITAGPDGALWFTNAGQQLHRAHHHGRDCHQLHRNRHRATRDGIAAGPDGALWFTNYGNDSIGRITTSGVVTNYTGTSISQPEGIAAGPDGACGSPTPVTTRSGASPRGPSLPQQRAFSSLRMGRRCPDRPRLMLRPRTPPASSSASSAASTA